MNALTRALAMLALAALVVGLLAAAVIAGSDHVDDRRCAIAFMIGVGYAWIATGLFAWFRRPANKVGALMAGDGLRLAAERVRGRELARDLHLRRPRVEPVPRDVRAPAARLPGGHAAPPLDRRIAAVVYALCAVGALPILLSGLEVTCERCPESVIQITDNTTVGTAGDVLTSVAAIIVAGTVIWVLAARWRAASRPQRRVLAPLLWSGIVLIALVAVTLTSQTVSGDQVPGILPVGVAGRLRRRPVRVPGRAAARPDRTGRRGGGAAAAPRRGFHGRPARSARGRARRSLAPAPVLGRGRLGAARRPQRGSAEPRVHARGAQRRAGRGDHPRRDPGARSRGERRRGRRAGDAR